jgi:hypothetical protein
MSRISIDEAIDEYLYWLYSFLVNIVNILTENIQTIQQSSDTLLTRVE